MTRKSIPEILNKRLSVMTMDPLEIKNLSIRFRLTQGQVRSLLMACGRDRQRLERAADRLRNR